MYEEIRVQIEKDNPSIRRSEDLCIRCGKCLDICKREIAVKGYFDPIRSGRAVCIHCGQCANVCPANSISERSEWMNVHALISSKGNKKIVFLTSPSVRVALGEEFGRSAGSYVEREMVGALRALGGDFVFDTTFAADLTIMEEANELIERVTKGGVLPQFTSCCPAWVKFAEIYYPELLPNLSTSKSPISMFSPVVKTWFAERNGLASSEIVTVAVTPCTAKKFEIRREEMRSADRKRQDTDYVITTRELAAWMRAENLDLSDIALSDYDRLMPRGSGAGVIFGNTGGVMEAAVRTAYYSLTGEVPPENLFEFEPVRGLEGVKRAVVRIGELTLNLAVVHGTANAKRFLKSMKQEETQYHFVEVMTCRGGCIGGGGQPKPAGGMTDAVRVRRMDGLYDKDRQLKLRMSQDNPEIRQVYESFFGTPGSALAERLLHTCYHERKELGEDPKRYDELLETEPETDSVCGQAGETGSPDARENAFGSQNPAEEAAAASVRKYRCKVCGYVHEGELPSDYRCPICGQGADRFEPVGE